MITQHCCPGNTNTNTNDETKKAETHDEATTTPVNEVTTS